MKTTTRIALLALVLSGALAAGASASTSIAAGIHIGPSGRATVDLGFFYDDLARYGNWIERPHYGWVWRPARVATTWRPYEYGHWVWTEYGWTWISDEPYGWATYHYGRWYDDPDYGWEWIPGDEWGPAWVDWHADDDYVGWAPLPPAYDVRYGRYDRGYDNYLTADDYVFVPESRFLATRVVQYAVPIPERERIYRRTRSYTQYRPMSGGYFNQGIPVTRVQQVIGRPVTRYQVADLAPSQRFSGTRIAQNRVNVFRPQVQRTRVAPPPSRQIARRSVLTAPVARQQLRQDRQIREQRMTQVQQQRQIHNDRQNNRRIDVQQQRQIHMNQRNTRQVQVQQQRQNRNQERQIRENRQMQVQQQRMNRQQNREIRELRGQQMRQERQMRNQGRQMREQRQVQVQQQRQVRQERQFRGGGQGQGRQFREQRMQAPPQRQFQPNRGPGGGGGGQNRPHGNPHNGGNGGGNGGGRGHHRDNGGQ